MRNADIDIALERSLSRERLAKYLAHSGGNLNAALALYEVNTRLAEAFYVPLQCLEICLRNMIHIRMSEVYGDRWLVDPAAAPLSDHSRKLVNEALRGVAGERTTGKIIAEAKFAFWVGLIGKHYDATIWRRSLHLAFRNGGGRSRKLVHGRLNAIRRLRNRIAHHEPIFDRPVLQLHAETLETIGWMCADTQAWAAHQSRVPAVLALQAEIPA